MAFQVSYVEYGAGATYQPNALTYISDSLVSLGITNTANILGVSATAIAGAMAEEANSYYSRVWQDDALDQFARSSITSISGAGIDFWAAFVAASQGVAWRLAA